MPKLLVLFQSGHPDVVALAEAARDGARGVRFAEVDLRRLPETDGAAGVETSAAVHRALEQVDDVAAYDGVVLVVSDSEGARGAGAAIAALGASLADKVGSVVTTATGATRRETLWRALTPMADRGMILVPASFSEAGEPAPDAARRLGKRVAEVIGWVTHARSHHHHEPPHHEHHHHDHHSHHQH